MRIRFGAVLLAMLAAAFVGTGPDPARAAGCFVPLFAYRHGTMILSEAGRVDRIRVEIADTDQQMEVGLMCRPSLEPEAGMLFDFHFTTQSPFWMKKTLIPLSIAFIDADWHIVRIMEMAVAPDPTADDPSKFPLYDPKKPYRYALEANAGYFVKHGFDEHAEVRFVPEGSFTPRPPARAEASGRPTERVLEARKKGRNCRRPEGTGSSLPTGADPDPRSPKNAI